MGYQNRVLTRPLSPLPLLLAPQEFVELDRQDRKEIKNLLLIRRHPDLNWG